jgi:hypothetical protein
VAEADRRAKAKESANRRDAEAVPVVDHAVKVVVATPTEVVNAAAAVAQAAATAVEAAVAADSAHLTKPRHRIPA